MSPERSCLEALLDRPAPGEVAACDDSSGLSTDEVGLDAEIWKAVVGEYHDQPRKGRSQWASIVPYHRPTTTGTRRVVRHGPTEAARQGHPGFASVGHEATFRAGRVLFGAVNSGQNR